MMIFSRFPLGQIVATPSVLAAVSPEDIAAAVRRHAQGDWGDLDPEDRATNNRALIAGSRLFSAYHAKNGMKFWIITEADRS